jgi:hypothetical protein
MRKYPSIREAGTDNRASASHLAGEDSAFTLRTVWRVRPVRLIIYVGLLLVVAIATAGSFAIASLRNNMLADSERELGNLATVLAEHVERTFETLTLTQLGFAQQVQALNILSLDDFEQRLSGPDIHLLLKDRINNLRSVRALMVASSRGRIINDSREWPGRGGDISEQDYFKALRFNAGPSTAISAPMQSSSGEGWIFHVAYNIVDPEQKVIGVIIGVLELRYFEQLFGQVIFGKGSSITLTRRDGRVLARYPTVDMRAAPSFGTSPLFTEVLPRAGRQRRRSSDEPSQRSGAIDRRPEPCEPSGDRHSRHRSRFCSPGLAQRRPSDGCHIQPDDGGVRDCHFLVRVARRQEHGEAETAA